MLNFDRPRTPVQWLIFLAATGIILSSPVGTRTFLKEVKKHISEQQRKKEREYEARQLSQALYYLKKRKIIKIESINGKTLIRLTESGKKRGLEYDVERLLIQRQAHWDGMWRMVMFDIPEDKKVAREALREKLKDMGFLRFQKSVWIYPYTCDEEIDFLSEYFLVASYVNLITVRIENDKPLRAEFKL